MKAGLQGARLGLSFGNHIHAGIFVRMRAVHLSRAWKLPVIPGTLVQGDRAATRIKAGLGGAAQVTALCPTHLFPTSFLQDENIMRSMQLFDNVI